MVRVWQYRFDKWNKGRCSFKVENPKNVLKLLISLVAARVIVFLSIQVADPIKQEFPPLFWFPMSCKEYCAIFAVMKIFETQESEIVVNLYSYAPEKCCSKQMDKFIPHWTFVLRRIIQ